MTKSWDPDRLRLFWQTRRVGPSWCYFTLNSYYFVICKPWALSEKELRSLVHSAQESLELKFRCKAIAATVIIVVENVEWTKNNMKLLYKLWYFNIY